MAVAPTSDDDRVARVAVRITDDALRWVRSGHPWVFADSVVYVADGGRPGDLAVIFDRKRRFQAIGLYDPASPIRIRILHSGKPTPIDDAWWAQRLAAVTAGRRALLASGDTTGVRCVNGENDHLPGLVVDRYADVAVVKVYTPAWLPHLGPVVEALTELVDVGTVVLRLSRRTRQEAPSGFTDGMALFGALPSDPVRFRENGLIVEADVVAGQKTGYFLDQRDNRRIVAGVCRGARVLDVFCASGGFTVAAAAGGATSVLSVDISGPALEATRRNLSHNRDLEAVRHCRHTTRRGDAFEIMAELARDGKRFDVVIVDPPSFAHDQAGAPRALRAYARLTSLAVGLVADDGMLVQASCSARVTADDFYATVFDSARRAGVQLEEVRRTGHPIDHAVGFDQGAYLKALFARVHRPDRSRRAGRSPTPRLTPRTP